MTGIYEAVTCNWSVRALERQIATIYEDAVNEMHRYRDAILWMAGAQGSGKQECIRESIGAFVLYPGNESALCSYPQVESIDQVNVGAMPLLPVEKTDC